MPFRKYFNEKIADLQYFLSLSLTTYFQQVSIDGKVLFFVSVFFGFMQRMLDYLKDKKDVGFFLSVQALMQTCRSVMNPFLIQRFVVPLISFDFYSRGLRDAFTVNIILRRC